MMADKSTIAIRKIGITSAGTQAVVDAANAQLLQGGGVCGVIFKAAGAHRLQKECDRIGHCPTGSAVITSGYDLCDYIIHAVGPIYQGGRNNEAKDLYSCYEKALDLAKENNINSIAFPLISSGIYGYPKQEAFAIALKSCDDWIRKNDDYQIKIIFAIIDDGLIELGEKTARELGIKTV